ncbi:MAG: M14 family zinc carboxypeptidase [Thermoanaerobaculia bacterium]
MTNRWVFAASLPAALVATSVLAAEIDWTLPLPPALPWTGASRALIAPAGDAWITPAEASGFRETPRYAETVAWLQRLATAAPEVRLVSLGTSPEGRELWMAVVSAEGAETPEALYASGKPVLLAQGGIHAGEIDGKDAGLMLLRDLTVGRKKRHLLERASLLFVPIFNVDGHERFSPYTRANQRGPQQAGWRTTAANLNLNRDYAKLDTPEMRSMVAAIERWRPDLYLDLHVTDGGDYQYDITYAFHGPWAWSPAISRWLEERFSPAVDAGLEAAGHLPGPAVFPVDPGGDPAQGVVAWTSDPRFSNAYGDARHLATVLVENHSLKPYDQRVLGTYVLLEQTLAVLGEHGRELEAAAASDAGRLPDPLPLAWGLAEGGPPRSMTWKGIERRLEPSAVSGAERVVWTGRPVSFEAPVFTMSAAAATVVPPRAYWIPPAWSAVIERLALHGVEFERIAAPRLVELEMYRLGEPTFETPPFEGRVRVTAPLSPERQQRSLPAGSVRVPTDQPLGLLAALLLEPASPDSFFQWGFFAELFSRTEYMEDYVLEPLAARMLAQDPALASEFERLLADDAAFAADPSRRRQWFYERTPYVDAEWRLYPVGREIAAEE